MKNRGKEPFDLRLTILRFLRNFPVILLVTVAGTLLFGGIYVVKNLVLRPAKTYSAEATFYVEYASDSWAADGTYINYMTWNTWLTSQEFTGYVQNYLDGENITQERLAASLSAEVPSDLRIPVVTATTENPELSERILEAAAKALVQDFPAGVKDVDTIRLTDTKPAEEVALDVRPVRAFVLSFVLCGFFAVVGFLLKELGSEVIYLPTTLTARYGCKQPGIPGTEMFAENLAYFLKGKKHLAVADVYDIHEPEDAAQEIRQSLLKHLKPEELPEIETFPCVAAAPNAAARIRKADGVVLIVRSGERDGRYLELTLDFLRQQDIEVTAAILFEQDKWLVKNYYRFEKL